MDRPLTLIASILACFWTTGLPAQQPGPAEKTKAQAKGEAAATKSSPAKETEQDKGKPKTSSDEEPVVTHHKIVVDGKDLKYTATAGLMPIKDAKGETEARIFFIAYTLDQPAPAGSRRSCSVSTAARARRRSGCTWEPWARAGLPLTEEPVIPAPPFRLVDNEATWLDRADLVFIDPVGTGYSRAAKPELNAKFHALRGDIESVGEFIRMYLTRYDRWASPLYLIGESYGTTRAAGLAGHLVDHGIAFNG